MKLGVFEVAKPWSIWDDFWGLEHPYSCAKWQKISLIWDDIEASNTLPWNNCIPIGSTKLTEFCANTDEHHNSTIFSFKFFICFFYDDKIICLSLFGFQTFTLKKILPLPVIFIGCNYFYSCWTKPNNKGLFEWPIKVWKGNFRP